VIHFDQVSKRYPNGREALAGVAFRIEPGELVFLTGHSGAGKSSILKLIALIERPTRGQVFINHQNTAAIKARSIPEFRRSLGVVFQDHKLLLDRPVADNVALPLIVAGVPRREIEKRMRAALDQVGLLGKERSRPLELSTGEQQRVGIARAIIGKPPLLIADEPTGNLDPDLALEIMQLFKRFNDVGVTVVVATHDVHLIERLGARRIGLVDGRVVLPGEADSRTGVGTGSGSGTGASTSTGTGTGTCTGSGTGTGTSTGTGSGTGFGGGAGMGVGRGIGAGV
jgi:cell division transport system ATP-binding protein